MAVIMDEEHALTPEELNTVGWELQNGPGGKKDENLAMEYYRRAAGGGCTRAMVNLGNIYENRHDYKNAYYWYLEAATLDDETGIFNVANMYHWGWYVSRDYEKALRYFKKLEESNNAEVYFYLGLYAENGYGQRKDIKKAIRYYEKGISLGDMYCPVQLGRIYSLGIGIPKDEKKGFELYQLGLQRGDTLCYANIGYCYETGQGVKKDRNMAEKYYLEGASKGDDHSKEHLKELRKKESQTVNEIPG